MVGLLEFILCQPLSSSILVCLTLTYTQCRTTKTSVQLQMPTLLLKVQCSMPITCSKLLLLQLVPNQMHVCDDLATDLVQSKIPLTNFIGFDPACESPKCRHQHTKQPEPGNAGQLKVSDLVTSLREIAHSDSQMAYHLWVLVFPIVWATLAEKKDQQVQLAKPIIQLLSKEHHNKQTHQRPNVVQVCKPHSPTLDAWQTCRASGSGGFPTTAFNWLYFCMASCSSKWLVAADLLRPYASCCSALEL